MISTIRAVVKKEWRDSIRDRRSMTAAILFAIAGPVLIAAMITATAERETSSEPFEVDVRGREHATDLIRYLQRNLVELVAEGEEAGVSLEIPEDYSERFGNGQTITLKVAADRSRSRDRRDAERLRGLVQGYSAALGQTRLALRGVAPSVARPIVADVKDLATREAKASNVLGLLTLYFLLGAFIGSMAVSIDVAAGERERNSLEVLMAQPISSTALFAGKTWVAGVFGATGVALTIVVSKLAFLLVPLEEIGLTWTLDGLDATWMLMSLLPLTLLVAALQVALSLWAKTFKEASAYLNILMFVPMGVALVILVKEIEPAPWMYSVPLLGHQQLLRSMIRGEPVDWMLVVLLTASTLSLAAALVYAGGRMLTLERIVFGESD